MAPKPSSKNKEAPESSKRKAPDEGTSKDKGKAPVTPASEQRSKKANRVFLGESVFYSDQCRQNYYQLTGVNEMAGVRFIDLDAFGDLPLYATFHFRALTSS